MTTETTSPSAPIGQYIPPKPPAATASMPSPSAGAMTIVLARLPWFSIESSDAPCVSGLC